MNTINPSTRRDHYGETLPYEEPEIPLSTTTHPIFNRISWVRKTAGLVALLGTLNTLGCQKSDIADSRDNASSNAQNSEISQNPSAPSEMKQSNPITSPPKRVETEEERKERILVGILQEHVRNPEIWKKSGGFYIKSYPYHLFKAILGLLPQPKNAKPIDLGMLKRSNQISSETVDPATLQRIDLVLEQLLQRIAYLNSHEFSEKFPDGFKSPEQNVQRSQEEIFQLFIKSYPLWKDKKYAQEVVNIFEAIQKRNFQKESQKFSQLETDKSPSTAL